MHARNATWIYFLMLKNKTSLHKHTTMVEIVAAWERIKITNVLGFVQKKEVEEKRDS